MLERRKEHREAHDVRSEEAEMQMMPAYRCVIEYISMKKDSESVCAYV